MSFSQLIFRFFIGGSVVVSVSLLAQVAGTGLAGRFMTVPALTALSLLFVYIDRGPTTASAVAKAGLGEGVGGVQRGSDARSVP